MAKIDLKTIASHPVALAVLPLKTAAIANAEQRARSMVAKIESDLAAVGWDINTIAPFPGYHETKGWSRFNIEQAKARYYLYHSVVTGSKNHTYYGRSGEPYIVEMAPERIEKFIDDAKEFAAAQYDSFVWKLVGKIGDCATASLKGNHVWGESFLTVTFANDKPTEVWKTQQIWNISKLGKDFQQWPSRKIKQKVVA